MSNYTGGLQGVLQGALQGSGLASQVLTSSGGSQQWGWNQAPTYTQPSTCACGLPGTRIFFNPKGISYNLGEEVPRLYLCSGCDFRFTVMRAAGRSEEFIAEYEEKQKVRATEEEKQREKVIEEYNRMSSQQFQQAYQQQWQNMQNVAPGLLGSGNCTVNGQDPLPAEPKMTWFEKFEQLFGRNQ